MSAAPMLLHGDPVPLAAGGEVEQWVEAGDDGIVVVSLDAAGEEVGRVSATRRPGHEAADLTAWTCRPWRRRGVAGAAMGPIADWAADHGVPYLVGAVAGDDVEATAFLRSLPLALSVRSGPDGRRFALSVA